MRNEFKCNGFIVIIKHHRFGHESILHFEIIINNNNPVRVIAWLIQQKVRREIHEWNHF